MRTVAFALGAVALAACDLRPNDAELRTGMTEEELNAPPGYHEMKAAILNDVRKWRMLEHRLEEGRPAVSAIQWVEKAPTCVRDKEEMEVYSLRHDLPDQPYRVEETAYFCRKEGFYYYHYFGGRKKTDTWMGPFQLDRKRVRPDKDQH